MFAHKMRNSERWTLLGLKIVTPLCGEESYNAARNTDYSGSNILMSHF
jgi:hypothetical protein